MTLVAGDRDVSTVEREIRETVIKCLAIELNDVRAAALVISVTRSAFLSHRVCLAPVKAPALQPIRSNLFVARKLLCACRENGT